MVPDDLAEDAEIPVDVKLGGTMDLGFAFGEMGMDSSEFRLIADTVRNIINRLMADFPKPASTD